ncbi:MAG: endopeptidase La [Mollicutes bacterium UO1]
MPWHQKTEGINDLEFARRKLDEKHYGLSEIKEKIIEYLAAQQKANKSLGQVVCLVGPPGVGKTSLAASIAEATGRKFVSISVGGVRDVAEIQGHRRTYIGAMPGRIIQAMKRSQVVNPLFLIDEIDKISHDFRGDPAYALLEALDPNQNKKFIDNYLGEDLPYNLSEVMFICTANDERDLPLPLLDRMEVVRLSSYTEIEKFHIAKEYIIPENLKKHNLNLGEIVFEDQAIRDIIKHYTREAGVRELSRKIQVIIRKFIVQILQNQKDKAVVTPTILVDYLKKKDYEFTAKQKSSRAGVATGLAWTGYGGDILPIEVVHYPRKEGDFELTGNLGDIMKESARVALNYIKSNHQKFGINLEVFSQNSIHIHAPEGATPKEGPSAGIALTSAIISVLTGRVIPRDIGMTGEITLHGHVEAIGGLKEKAIAACRSELKTIIIPKSNEKDIEDIPEEVRQELKIITVEEYEEVWETIFGKKQRKTTLPLVKQPRKRAKEDISLMN